VDGRGSRPRTVGGLMFRLNWEDERYVRLHTRDTADWLMLSWDAQALYMQIRRKVDRAGILHLGKHGLRGVFVAINQPHLADRLAEPLQELLGDGCVKLCGAASDQLLLEEFIEAEETALSTRERKRASRERVRDRVSRGEQATGQIVTNRDDVTERDQTSRLADGSTSPVTDGDYTSQNVTDGHDGHANGHARSQMVTPSVPSFRAVPTSGRAHARDEDQSGVQDEGHGRNGGLVTAAEAMAAVARFLPGGGVAAGGES
jgi:hypothetical protein